VPKNLFFPFPLLDVISAVIEFGSSLVYTKGDERRDRSPVDQGKWAMKMLATKNLGKHGNLANRMRIDNGDL
jgi:hypothetical protein